MPRPPRRTRAVASQAAPAATAKETAAEATQSKPAEKENRRRTRRSDAAPAPSASSTREQKRQTPRQAPAAREQRRPAAAASAAAAAARPTRGPNESGIDIQDDDTFGDMNTSFDNHDLDNLSDLSDLGDLSGLDDLGSSPAAGSTTGSTRGRSTVAAHSTDTTGASTSSFNVGLFRRGRPRQSSVHSRDDAPIRPSSRGGPTTPSLSSTFSLGTFRRRAREPSILGRRRRHTSRHSSRDRSGGEMSGSELESDLGGPDLLTSDAESSSMPTTLTATAPGNTTSVLMNKIRSKPAATRSKKRKSEEAPHEDELPKRRSLRRSGAGPAEDDNVLPSVEAPSSLPPSTPPSQILRSADDRRRYTTPPVEVDPEIMAPPASSGSSSASPFMWPSLRGLTAGARRGNKPAVAAARQRTPELISDEISDISSPPSLTHSPNYQRPPSRAATAAASKPATRGKGSNTLPKPLTTEALTALLPQRRRRARGAASDAEDEDELDHSALLSEDDDELAHGPAGRRRPLRATRSATRTPAAATAISATASTNRRTAAGTKKKPVRRTYGSRSFSDKENQEENEENQEANGSTFSPLPDNAFADDENDDTVETVKQSGRKAGEQRYFGEEVEKASKKFKEVDQWTLEFESVSRSSSPAGAR